MLRTRNPVHALSPSDRDDALQLCAQDLPANVFVAARLLEGVLTTQPGTLLGLRTEGTLRSVCWSSANLVPVQTDADSLGFFADRVRRWRRHCASILGPADQVSELWRHLGPTWGPARAVRSSQPLMSTMTRPSELGVALDDRVRPATLSEVDLVMPAAAQMFEGEIGYPPYTGSGAAYRQALQALIDRGHTFVVVEDGTVVFKADVGSVALGCAQLQGVWLHPELRGRGLAVPMMAAVVEQVMATRAKWVTLYVNDFNASARSTYRHVGFEDVGTFSTVLL
ncbi:GNAT family N-acetyltransferase [Pedococcus sp.]|uniref:GNAT family N-acetyltransferase n=1 Tax=Pedococcus sp. TaxID=2860345 RepID=UPI002E13468E|nr:GNAT family N-acetyltransferase [Pedococcus sp.]